MKNLRIIFLLFVVFLAFTQVCFASSLPDLPKQELGVKIISVIVGLIIIFAICIMGLNRLLYGTMGLEADNATKISIVVAVILSFLWFLFLFGQIFSTMVTIASVALVIIVLLIFFIRGSDNSGSDSSIE